MPYIGGPIRPHEELRAGMVEAEALCSICRAKSEINCDNCQDSICLECAISCGHCQTDAYCIVCAIKRGYVEIEGQYHCENCQPETESEMEMLRR